MSSTIVHPNRSDVSVGSRPQTCRFCQSTHLSCFVDLGMSPLCESFVSAERANQVEHFYPLHAVICHDCLLVQLDEYVKASEIFNDQYAYFSSYSDSWLAHCRNYTDRMIDRFGLDANSQVVEVASNDGYLLQYFVQRGIQALGIEPAGNCAEAARAKGVPTHVAFFGQEIARQLADQGQCADLLIGNNVLAHVPQLNDFVAGLAVLLNLDGVLTMEFPHLLKLIEGNQFDTIYHEHFCYFSFFVVQAIFRRHGLRIFDVEQLSTHGGSLRIFACHEPSKTHRSTDAVAELLDTEQAAGLRQLETYQTFARQVEQTKWNLLECLIDLRRQGKRIAGYGAPGKGNTLLNYCGIREDLLEFVVDRNPFKHGKLLPGTRIPIFPPETLEEQSPDYILILPWNLRDEIIQQLSGLREKGAKFILPIPQLEILA